MEYIKNGTLIYSVYKSHNDGCHSIIAYKSSVARKLNKVLGGSYYEKGTKFKDGDEVLFKVPSNILDSIIQKIGSK